MKINKHISQLLIIILLTSLIFTGCSSKDQNFTYSRDLNSKGYWRGVKALDHVTLADYSNLLIPKEKHTVTDEEIDREVKEILESFSEKEEVTDAIEVRDGDTLKIVYVGKVDGVPFEGGATGEEGAEVTIGVTNYIDGFLDQLIGHYPGETFDINVTFPTDYHNEDLKGKDAVFTITIMHLLVSVYPELTDEFVMENFYEVNGWQTKDQVISDIKEDLRADKISGFIQTYLLENSEIKELPHIISNYQDEYMLLIYTNYASQYQMTLNDFLRNYMGIESKEELLEQNRQSNDQVANLHLIIQAIGEQEKIVPTDKDVDNYFKEYMDTDNYSDFKEVYGMNYLKLTTLVQKVLDHIESIATFED